MVFQEDNPSSTESDFENDDTASSRTFDTASYTTETLNIATNEHLEHLLRETDSENEDADFADTTTTHRRTDRGSHRKRCNKDHYSHMKELLNRQRQYHYDIYQNEITYDNLQIIPLQTHDHPNSLFQSVAYLLFPNGSFDHMYIRREAIQFMRNNPKEFPDTLPSHKVANLRSSKGRDEKLAQARAQDQQRLNYLARNGSWPNSDVLRAISYRFNCHITIWYYNKHGYQPNDGNTEVMAISPVDYQHSIHLDHFQLDFHFNPIIPRHPHNSPNPAHHVQLYRYNNNDDDDDDDDDNGSYRHKI